MEKSKEIKFNVAYTESIDGGFVGFLEELPGVMSQGETMEDLRANLIDAMFVMFTYNKSNKHVSNDGGDYKSEQLMVPC